MKDRPRVVNLCDHKRLEISIFPKTQSPDSCHCICPIWIQLQTASVNVITNVKHLGNSSVLFCFRRTCTPHTDWWWGSYNRRSLDIQMHSLVDLWVINANKKNNLQHMKTRKQKGIRMWMLEHIACKLSYLWVLWILFAFQVSFLSHCFQNHTL